jgi:CheY-like chemotaxis protein
VTEPARKTILVVEDDARVRSLLRFVVHRGNYGLIETVDGESALEAVERQRPDLIILDVNLPGIDGIEVCRRLKAGEKTRDVKVLMVTAAIMDEDRARGLAAGADGYVTKPFSPLALLKQIQEELP